MKYKKYTYIIVLILMLVIGINPIEARRKPAVNKDPEISDYTTTCYYISSDDELRISFSYGLAVGGKIGGARTTLWQTSIDESPLTTHNLANKNKNITHYGIKVEEFNPIIGSNYCPKTIVYTSCPGWFFGIGTTETTLAVDSDLLAADVVSAASGKCDYAKAASNFKNGKQITDDMFMSKYTTSGLIKYDSETDKYTCADVYEIFGDKDDPESIRYMINEILWYVRVIVPILVILLGTIDFAKAVIAGKVDNMKKAQSDFIKRIIAGVVVFLIPTFIDILMGLADIVWAGDYTYCKF